MYKLYCGDSLEVMKGMPSNWIDSVITDPPYGIEFMGKNWDFGIPGVEYWKEALRVAKPGATLFAFGGTRTHHRLMVAIEDSGWIIRDVIMWIYGSGMPHGLNISKGIDKAAGAEREVIGKRNINYSDTDTWGVSHKSGRSKSKTIFGHGRTNVNPGGTRNTTAPATESAELWDGWNTQLKPAWEPIIVAMKPVDEDFVNNALTHGVAGYNVDGSRIPTGESLTVAATKRYNNTTSGGGLDFGRQDEPGGRYPANVIFDGSDDVLDLFPHTKTIGGETGVRGKNSIFGTRPNQTNTVRKNYKEPGGSTARFFYCAKAAKTDKHAGLQDFFWKVDKTAAIGYTRIDEDEYNTLTPRKRAHGNIHTTVKPAALMEYLNRLTKTPTGGIVLDPFNGSGSTGVGAIANGRDFVGIDLSQEYIDITTARLDDRQKLYDAQSDEPRQLSF